MSDREREDFEPRPILEALARHDVRYVLIGGLAAAIYGAPFMTSDIDIVPSLQLSNLERLTDVLVELEARSMDEPGGREVEISGQFLKRNLPDLQILHFRTKHGLFDLLYNPAGTDGYSDLVRGVVEFEIDETIVPVAGLEDIIRSKGAAGRERDRWHLATLRQLLEIRSDRAPDA